MQKNECLYSGKVKSLFRTEDENILLVEFRNDVTAYDGEMKDSIDRRGKVNNHFNDFMMQKLSAAGIPSHHIRLHDDTHSLVKHLNMLPVECVVRNIAAGSLCRRLGTEEGLEFSTPMVEFFLKNDDLHDPMITRAHMDAFGWATSAQADAMQALALKANDVLKPMFADVGIKLVDFKLEFGLFDGVMTLGDEFTPDACRLWDAETGASLDKDVFRKGTGDLLSTYEAVAERLGLVIG